MRRQVRGAAGTLPLPLPLTLTLTLKPTPTPTPTPTPNPNSNPNPNPNAAQHGPRAVCVGKSLTSSTRLCGTNAKCSVRDAQCSGVLGDVVVAAVRGVGVGAGGSGSRGGLTAYNRTGYVSYVCPMGRHAPGSLK